MEEWIIAYYVLVVLCLIGFVVYWSMFYKKETAITFLNGSFVIQSISNPYRCVATSNGFTTMMPCDSNNSTQYYRYDRTTNTIVTNSSTCLTYNATGGRIYDAACPTVVYVTCENSSSNSTSCQSTSYLTTPNTSGQTFFYNATLPVLQSTSSVSNSTLFVNMSTTSNNVLMTSSSSTDSASYFKCVPKVTFGQWSGRYIRVNVSSIGCLNMTEITVLSNPWDKFNAAISATLTRSSDRCTGTPWVQLDFGRVVPLTQIVLIGSSIPSSSHSVSGAVLSIADYNSVVNYISDPIEKDASYTVFNPPQTKSVQSVTAAVPVTCDMSSSLYTYLYPPVTTKAWDHYLATGRTKGYSWYGPQCIQNPVQTSPNNINPDSCPTCDTCPACQQCPTCASCPVCTHVQIVGTDTVAFADILNQIQADNNISNCSYSQDAIIQLYNNGSSVEAIQQNILENCHMDMLNQVLKYGTPCPGISNASIIDWYTNGSTIDELKAVANNCTGHIIDMMNVIFQQPSVYPSTTSSSLAEWINAGMSDEQIFRAAMPANIGQNLYNIYNATG